MSFSFQQIRYFVAVAEAGSITVAAHDLLVSQSTITEAIKSLEAYVGVTLVHGYAHTLDNVKAPLPASEKSTTSETN